MEDMTKGLHDKEHLGDNALLERVVAKLDEVERFSDVRIDQDEEHSLGQILFQSRQDGVVRHVAFDWNLLAGAEYRSLAKNQAGLEAMACKRFILAHGDERSEHESLDEVLGKLYTGAEKGITTQRYKGLGEMNADQLWETTMDPSVRNLLQVRIEDAVAADEIFSILMGDNVEPRRDFIVDNALEVKNLDV